MVRPSEQALAYRKRIAELSWDDLSELWNDLQGGRLAGWDAGKALEYLVVRGFALSGLRVEYPYEVPLVGHPLEQIDGMVYLGDVPFLIECKDRQAVDIQAIAKMRNQLMRRPPATMGCVFVSGTFTRPAVTLCDFAAPHRITLWSGVDIADALQARDFAQALRRKYDELCMFGLTDHSPYWREQEIDAR
jgi:hypothetical protein